ncbi:Glucose dehydrogenase [FAD, quinone] [Gryllus bimaculatus]|nr:Glucose dehydrogenase [FAD, quinone] [Gryllus bimaculatus]
MYREEFDFIIVGAGASGGAVALRLTENPNWKVLLLEAGGEEESIMDIPLLLGQFLGTDANWHYRTTPQTTCCVLMKDSRCDYPAGRMVGGGTPLTLMLTIRGSSKDYDNWANMGNKGWSFADVLPYFKKLEDVQIPEIQNSDYRGYGGRIKISYTPYFFDVGNLILKAAEEAGFPMTDDYNGEKQTGTGRMQTTTYKGSRWSANPGYLDEARARPNLFLRTRSFATRLVLEGVRARGVRYERGGHEHVAYATREVILSAGAVNSPAILMHSGIGPADHLQQLGIPVVQPLPVGHNLMDHTALIATFTTLNETVSPSIPDVLLNPLNLVNYFARKSGPFTSPGGFEAITFHEVKGAKFHTPGWPDVEILYASTNPLATRGLADVFRLSDVAYDRLLKPIKGKPAIFAAIWRLRPKSRGRIYLLNNDTSTPPQIDLRGLSDAEDRQAVLAGLRAFQKVVAAPSLQKVGARMLDIPVPGCEDFDFDSDEYWDCAMQQMSITIYHQSGTAKMGHQRDPTAVVTPDLKVIGVDGLRVVDSSIMPSMVAAHFQMPCYMIGERAADLIKQSYQN